MAVHRNNDLRFSPPVNPRQAGETITVVSRYTITENIANGDEVEMGALPAGCALVDFQTSRTATHPNAALDFGIIQGEFLSDSGRDLPSSGRILSNQAASQRDAGATAANIEFAGRDVDHNVTRGIGFQPRGALSGGNGGTVTIVYKYMAVGNA